ncbi:hypothetical protein CMUS01_08542 [Colletotrichum musicola]|uniref:Aminoglycoside phosphotransferase domain-containing protein n=1 Tax=Colletotrichum musicola TaxID=2175873 RepID=A0A8H6NDF6_9PEZI|nr:hypothetical protein CMUS01_08542 [Colletotrichum musicola]
MGAVTTSSPTPTGRSGWIRAFNKLYVVKHADEEVVARVTLPVDPKWKTLSEVATLQWVREKTTLPVPKVLGYSADRANRVGFEWIIMDKVHGKPYADVLKEVPYAAKEQLVRRIANFYSDTFANQFRGIGNIFQQPAAVQNQGDEKSGTNDDEVPLAPGFTVQRLVSSTFFSKDPHPEVSRGPFASSREWISARLDLTEIQCTERLHRLRQAAESTDEKSEDGVSSQAGAEEADAGNANRASADKDGRVAKDEDKGEGDEDTDEDEDEEDEEDDEEDIENALSIIARLRRQLPDFFPSGGPEPEPSVLFHDDMNSHNVLVDETGNLTAVVDWECVSTLPLCLACEYPSFIQSKPNEFEPIKSTYHHDENREVTVLFWEHLEHYEKTQLRKLFLAEMETLQPRRLQERIDNAEL